jgi:hypothetical protein
MGKPFGKASRRTFGRIGTLVPFPCWNSLGVMSSDTLKFSKRPPSEALKGGLPVSVLQLSGKDTLPLGTLQNFLSGTRWNEDDLKRLTLIF